MKLHLTMIEGSHFKRSSVYIRKLLYQVIHQEIIKFPKMVIETNLMRSPVQPPSQNKPVANTGLGQHGYVQPRMAPAQPCSAVFSYQGEFGSVTFVNPLQIVICCYQIAPQPSPQATSDVLHLVLQALDHLCSLVPDSLLFLRITPKRGSETWAQCLIFTFTSTKWQWMLTMLPNSS